MLGAYLRPLFLICFLLLPLGSIAPAFAEDLWPRVKQSTFYSAQASNDNDKDVYEPSGAAPPGLFLYIVSDNGKVGRQLLAQDQKDFDSHQIFADKEGDFEAVAAVPSQDSLFLGVEGDGAKVPKPKVVEYSPPSTGRLTSGNAQSSLTGCEWPLDLPLTRPSDPKKKPNGMEALTFVPDGHHPYTDSTGGFGGYFFASSQATPGEIRVYDLERIKPDQCASDGIQPVSSAQYAIKKPLLSGIALSDLYYSNSQKQLFALYDESGHELQVLTLHGDGDNARYVQSELYAPEFGHHDSSKMKGMEAVALDPNSGDLYIGLDQSRKQATNNGNCHDDKHHDCDTWKNYVYRYAGFGN